MKKQLNETIADEIGYEGDPLSSHESRTQPSAHTTGPWNTNVADHAIEILCDGFIVADVYIPEKGCSGPINFAEAKANARLIAAAPELLAAAQLAVEWAEAAPAPYRDWPHVLAARAALAKAQGS